MAAFPLSDDASYVTGAILAADGGRVPDIIEQVTPHKAMDTT